MNNLFHQFSVGKSKNTDADFDGPATARQRDVDFAGSSTKAHILQRQKASCFNHKTLSHWKYVGSDTESAE